MSKKEKSHNEINTSIPLPPKLVANTVLPKKGIPLPPTLSKPVIPEKPKQAVKPTAPTPEIELPPRAEAQPESPNKTHFFNKRKLITPLIFLITCIIIPVALTLTFIFTATIPSSSMLPTVETKTTVIGFKNIPLNIQQGDMIIFKGSGDWGDSYFLKRVIGMPGDTIEYTDGEETLILNGEPLEEPYLFKNIPGNETFSYTVPENMIFVLGDNRLASDDSRTHEQAYIPIEDVVTKPFGSLAPELKLY